MEPNPDGGSTSNVRTKLDNRRAPVTALGEHASRCRLVGQPVLCERIALQLRRDEGQSLFGAAARDQDGHQALCDERCTRPCRGSFERLGFGLFQATLIQQHHGQHGPRRARLRVAECVAQQGLGTRELAGTPEQLSEQILQRHVAAVGAHCCRHRAGKRRVATHEPDPRQHALGLEVERPHRRSLGECGLRTLQIVRAEGCTAHVTGCLVAFHAELFRSLQRLDGFRPLHADQQRAEVVMGDGIARIESYRLAMGGLGLDRAHQGRERQRQDFPGFAIARIAREQFAAMLFGLAGAIEIIERLGESATGGPMMRQQLQRCCDTPTRHRRIAADLRSKLPRLAWNSPRSGSISYAESQPLLSLRPVSGVFQGKAEQMRGNGVSRLARQNGAAERGSGHGVSRFEEGTGTLQRISMDHDVHYDSPGTPPDVACPQRKGLIPCRARTTIGLNRREPTVRRNIGGEGLRPPGILWHTITTLYSNKTIAVSSRPCRLWRVSTTPSKHYYYSGLGAS